MTALAERIESLEAEVKELRELVRPMHREHAEAIQQTRAETKRAIGTVASRGPNPNLRG
jgi:uncharacterized coiled-coil DUF342 family protein